MISLELTGCHMVSLGLLISRRKKKDLTKNVRQKEWNPLAKEAHPADEAQKQKEPLQTGVAKRNETPPTGAGATTSQNQT